VIDVVTIGETLATVRSETVGALSVGSNLRLSFAGAESNVAIGLTRLGHHVRWTGCVGDDDLGRMVVRSLRGEGIDTSYVRVVNDAPTALLVKHQRMAHVSRVAYYRSGSAGARISTDLAVAAVADGPRLLHVTGITPALSASAAEAIAMAVTTARQAGALVSFDVNYRAALWPRDRAAAALQPLSVQADIVFASEDELDLLIPLGKDNVVVITRGADGAAVITADGKHEHPAVDVVAVDTVGAGDAFVAGYLSGLLDGLDVESCLQRGSATAAFAVSTHGDWEGLPTRAELSLLDCDEELTIR